MTYPCPRDRGPAACGREFATQRGLYQHLRRAHGSIAAPAPAVDYGWAEDPRAVDPRAAEAVGRVLDATPLHGVGRPAPAGTWTAGDAAPAALAHYQGEAEAALESVGSLLPDAMAEWSATLQDAQVLQVIDWAQQMRRALTALEDAAVELARTDARLDRQGTMPDGRRYTLQRGTDRKAWDRDAVEHDVRQAVWSGSVFSRPSLALVDTASGEVVDDHPAAAVFGALAAVQRVAGSGPPRVTNMRALGLDPDEYCSSSPGRWSVRFTDPTTEG